MLFRLVYRFVRLGYGLFLRPPLRVAAEVASTVFGAATSAGAGSLRHRRDWWITTLIASAASLAIGVTYAATIWPAAAMWFAIAVLLPVRGFSEGLRTVPYYLLSGVLLSTVPVVGWWLAGAAVLAAAVATALAWVRWRGRARRRVAPSALRERPPSSRAEASDRKPIRIGAQDAERSDRLVTDGGVQDTP